jgi:FkbM family methyltransferase
MKDYSQTGEQAEILRIVQAEMLVRLELGRAPGRFLDIGAWVPETFSNTRALFDQGWHGIYLEPSPGPVKALVKEYGMSDRAIVIAAAVTVNGGMVELQVTDDAVSCIPGSSGAKVWDKDGGFYGKLLVPSISMADLFTRFGGDFDMVSIDTEGTSAELFIAMLGTGVRPRCVVVEHDNRIVELAQYAQAASYRQALLNGNNVVYEWTSGL